MRRIGELLDDLIIGNQPATGYSVPELFTATRLAHNIHQLATQIDAPGGSERSVNIFRVLRNYTHLLLESSSPETTQKPLLPESTVVLDRRALTISPFTGKVVFDHREDYLTDTQILILYYAAQLKISDPEKRIPGAELAELVGLGHDSLHSIVRKMKMIMPDIPFAGENHEGYSLIGELNESDGGGNSTDFEPIRPI